MEKILPFLGKDEIVKKIKEICSSEGIDFDAFKELVEEEFRQFGKAKKREQTGTLDDVLRRIYKADLVE